MVGKVNVEILMKMPENDGGTWTCRDSIDNDENLWWVSGIRDNVLMVVWPS